MGVIFRNVIFSLNFDEPFGIKFASAPLQAASRWRCEHFAGEEFAITEFNDSKYPAEGAASNLAVAAVYQASRDSMGFAGLLGRGLAAQVEHLNAHPFIFFDLLGERSHVLEVLCARPFIVRKFDTDDETTGVDCDAANVTVRARSVR